MSESKEQQFWDAAKGDLSLVKELAADTTRNINWQEPQLGYTPFNGACVNGRASVVEFFLTHND